MALPHPSRPYDPSEDEFETTLHHIVEVSRPQPVPGRSLGAIIRWQYRGRWTDGACDRLREAGLRTLRETQTRDDIGSDLVALPVSGVWLTTEEVAVVTGTAPETIAKRLRTLTGRRDYGWPWWTGSRWRIPGPAVDPMQRAAYMASLPEAEPPAHVASLPDWCER